MKKFTTVFLGGTCGKSTWRNELLSMLNNHVKAFNPVVANWTPDHILIEEEHKTTSGVLLFVITPDEPSSAYSASEVTAASIFFPSRTVLCVLTEYNGLSFSPHRIKSWGKISNDCQRYGATVCNSLQEVAAYINNKNSF